MTLSPCLLAHNSENLQNFQNDQCLWDANKIASGWQPLHTALDRGAQPWKELGRLRELGLATPALNLWDGGKGLKVKLIFNSQ